MAGIKQPEGLGTGARAPSLPDAAPRPSRGGGGGPSASDVAADTERLASLLRPARRDGTNEGAVEAVRDDDEDEGGGGREKGQDFDGLDAPATNPPPDRRGSRAEDLLAFLGGAQHQRAATGAALTRREDNQGRPPGDGDPSPLGSNARGDDPTPAALERPARDFGDDERPIADGRYRHGSAPAQARLEGSERSAFEQAADPGPPRTADQHARHGTASAVSVSVPPQAAAPGHVRLEAQQDRHHDAAPPGAGPGRPETAAADRTAIEDGRELLNQQRRHDAAPPAPGRSGPKPRRRVVPPSKMGESC